MRSALCLLLVVVACDDAHQHINDADARDAMVTDARLADATTADAAIEPDAAVPDAPRAPVAHAFGDRTLEPYEEVTRCVQWTLGNAAPLYVEGVSLANGGGLHHSNWFVVPEDVFPGRDGYFRCGTRDFNEIGAALRGTVLFAQSTQSLYEEQRMGDGVVIRVPPRHKVIANVHMLNLSAAPVTTHLRMTLDLLHPRGVRTVVTPFRYSYLPLELPPLQASRFVADCDLRTAQTQKGLEFSFKIHWLLPHYHALGNYFDVTVRGGSLDGESIMRLDEFNAEPNGKLFDPPLDVSDANGLAVTCGFDNPRREPVGWGIGDQEMCVMLGFAEAEVMMDASVVRERVQLSEGFDVTTFGGGCLVLALDKSSAHAPPTPDELEGELYVPESADDPGEIAGPPECVDTPADAEPDLAPTTVNVSGAILLPSCSFTACHGGTTPAAGLRLDHADRDALRAELTQHTVASASDLPLIAPGDPEGSLLYRRVSRCAPGDGAHMPLNAPTLLPAGRVAMLRDWIAAELP